MQHNLLHDQSGGVSCLRLSRVGRSGSGTHEPALARWCGIQLSNYVPYVDAGLSPRAYEPPSWWYRATDRSGCDFGNDGRDFKPCSVYNLHHALNVFVLPVEFFTFVPLADSFIHIYCSTLCGIEGASARHCSLI